jgi:Tol biopolymer transport system component/DNA-binding winged helix-turn-helix (wHTH) protein
MVESSKVGRVFRFDAFEVDLQERELRKFGRRVKVQEQPFQILLLLLERPGTVLAREDLRKALWPDGTFVDFEHGLNTAIKKLRDALGDSAEIPRFVETVARRGYRFIGNVQTPVTSPSPESRRWQQRFATRTVVLGGLVACTLALCFLYFRNFHRSEEGHLTVTPAVTHLGEKYTPSLSPDGQHLAFAWNGGAGPEVSLYVKLVGTEESLRLTKQASIDFNPVWSPDGRYIAFCRIQEGQTGIYIIPALGGVERRVRKTHWTKQEFYEVFWYAGRLSWSPDGRLLAFSDRGSDNESASSIFLLALDSQEVRRLTSPLVSRGDFNPEFSPDGRLLAFNRVAQGIQSIYTLPTAEQGKEHLVCANCGYWGLAWTPDGHDIVFGNASWLANAGWLWKVAAGGGEPERLEFAPDGVEPSIRRNRLAYVHQVANISIWTRKVNSLASAKPSSSQRFISSTRMESGPQFSPDGTRVAFESTRSGAYEVWMCQSDGTRLTQLTNFNSVTGTPRWSPDGQKIVFDSRVDGNANLFVIDSEGGTPRRLTSEPSRETVPSWSRDGRWIYFASDRSGASEVWKIPSTGGAAVQVTRHGGFAPFESPDENFLYYAKGLTVPGLWRVPTKGGKEVEVIRSLEAGFWGYWAVVGNGIYYLETTANPRIAFFDTRTHHTRRVFDLENLPVREAPGLAVAPDKETILYTQLDILNSEIIVAENFR